MFKLLKPASWPLALLLSMVGCSVSREQSGDDAQVVWLVTPQSLTAGTEQEALVHLQVAAVAGESGPRVRVRIEASPWVRVIEQPGPLDATGSATARVCCVSPGEARLTALLDGVREPVPLAAQGRLVCLPVQIGSGQPNSVASGTPGLEPPRLVFVAQAQSIAADANAPTALVLSVTSSTGAPLANQGVTLLTTRAGDVVQPAYAATNAQGQVSLTLTSTTLGEATIVARTATSQASVVVQVVSGPPHLPNSSLLARPVAVVANTVDVQFLDVVLRDAVGRLVPSVPVQLTSDANGDILSPAVGVTDANGRLTVSLTGAVPGPREVHATCHVGTLSVQVLLLPGPVSPVLSSFSAAPGAPTADGVSQAACTVMAKDIFGHLAVGQNATFSLAGNAHVWMPQTGTLDGNGTLKTWLTSTLAGTQTAWCSMGNVVLSAPVTFAAGPPDATNTTLALSPNAVVADALSSATLTLVARDAFANVVPGASVVFLGGEATAYAPAAQTTDANGLAAAAVTTTLATEQNACANVAGFVLCARLSAVGGAPSAAHSSLTASPNTAVADNAATVTLTATFADVYGNPLVNQNVTWLGVSSQETFGQTDTTTSAAGVAVTSLASTLAHAVAPIAQMQNVSLVGQATFVAGSPNAAMSWFVVSPNQLVADEIQQASATAMVNDVFANPVSGARIIFAARSPNASLSANQVFTSTMGLATALVSSSLASSQQVTATLPSGEQFLGELTFVAGDPNRTRTMYSVSPNSLLADGNQAVMLNICVVDAFGNAVPNVPVSFGASMGNVQFVPAAGGVTSNTGIFSGTATSQTAQAQQLSFNLPQFSISANVTFLAGPIDFHATTFVALPSAGMASDGQASTQLTFTARDGRSRPMGGQSVTFYQVNPQGLLKGLRALTSATGVGSMPLFSTSGGLQTVYARSGNVILDTQVNFSTQTPRCPGAAMIGGRALSFVNTGHATHMKAADMDNDGLIDVVFTSDATPGLSIHRNKGGGTFKAPLTFATQGVPQHMVIVDLNKDGYKDVVVTSRSNYILTYKGAAGAALSAGVKYTLQGTLLGLCTADMNADGLPDVLAVSTGSSPGFSVVLGNGTGGFKSNKLYTSTGKPMHCVAADFNNDGRMDVAITNANGTSSKVDIYLGNASGTLNAKTSFAAGANANDIVAADLNGDGHLDLVVSNSVPTAGALSVLLGNGTGGFNAAVSYGADAQPNGLDVGDINGDGNLDIVVGTGVFNLSVGAYNSGVAANSLNVFLGNGNGALMPLQRIEIGIATGSVALGDFDQDGNMDIGYSSLIRSYSGMAFARTCNSFPAGMTFASQAASTSVILGDYNSDGNIDVATIGDLGTYLWEGDGSGRFQSFSLIASLQGSYAGLLALDFNGDGDLDIVVYGLTTGKMYLLAGDGQGHFAQSQLSTGSCTASTYIFAVAGDTNGDGMTDLILQCDDTNHFITVMSDGATGSLPPVETSYPDNNGGINYLVAGDINNDGKADLISCGDKLITMLGDGHGGFLSSAAVEIPDIGGGYSLFGVALVDLNGDGYPDLLVNALANFVVLLNDGLGGFSQSQTTYLGGLNIQSMNPIDLNGDGLPDLLIPTSDSSSGNGISTAYGDGGGHFVFKGIIPTGLLRDIVIGDVNNDGRADAVMALTDMGLVVLPNNGCAPY